MKRPGLILLSSMHPSTGIRNHDHLRPADFYPLLDFFRRDQLDQEPSPLNSNGGKVIIDPLGLIQGDDGTLLTKGAESLSFVNISRQSSFIGVQGIRYLGRCVCEREMNRVNGGLTLDPFLPLQQIYLETSLEMQVVQK